MLLSSPVAVFDSGLGSLSIIRELKKEIPRENLLYLADKSSFPYGTKSHADLLRIVSGTITYLKRYKPKLILVASNTPSIQVLEEIKKKVDIQVMGVKPPLKQASQLTKKKHIGIMATWGTANSTELDNLIRKEVPQSILVTRFNASPIIELIESGTYLNNERLTFNLISQILGDDVDNRLDVIVLCSTHLPFVMTYLNALLPTVRFIDPAKIVAREVRKFLKFNRMLKKSGSGRLEILVTHEKKQFESALQAMGVKQGVKEVFVSY
jgi:glutamate racemase